MIDSLTTPFNKLFDDWYAEYTISLGRDLEEGEKVWVSLTPSDPDIFVIESDGREIEPGDRVALFTPEDSSPQTIRIRMAVFSIEDYILRDLADFPDRVTLVHKIELEG